jgi:drug/metabolite transporter (DMT)-like permease
MFASLKQKFVIVDPWSKGYFVPFCAIFCCLLWGSAFPAIKIIFAWIEQPSPSEAMALAGLRFFLAGVFVLAPNLRHLAHFKKISLLHWLWLGLLQVVLQYSLFYVGLTYVSGMLGAIMVSTGSLWWVLLAPFFDASEHWNVKAFPILCIGIVGVGICVSGSNQVMANPLLGICLLVAATLCNILVSLKVKPLSKKMPVTIISGGSLAIGGLMLMGIVGKQTIELSMKMDGYTWGLTIYLALISAVAFSLWFVLITHVAVQKLSAYRLLIPVIGVGMSALILPQEKLTLPFLFGGILVLICIQLMADLPHAKP